MIVDDQRSLVALAEETLATLGYEPVGFDSSVAALQAFRADPRRFDLVLTDETMPDMSGWSWCARCGGCARAADRADERLQRRAAHGARARRRRGRGAAQALVRRDIAEALGRALRPTIAATSK